MTDNGTKVNNFLGKVSSTMADLFFGPSPSILVSSLISDIVIDVLKKQLGLTGEEQEDVRKRAQLASEHLSEAGRILTDLQVELNQRNHELEELVQSIDKRRSEAEHWQEIASTNEKLASALTKEIERRVGEQIRAELDRNKTRRQIIGGVVWIVTLLLGGIVGAAIQQWWQTGRIIP